MICTSCGEALANGTYFCPKCGANLMPPPKTVTEEIFSKEPAISKKRARIRLIIFTVLMNVFIVQAIVGSVYLNTYAWAINLSVRAMLTFFIALGFVWLCGFWKTVLLLDVVHRKLRFLVYIPVIGWGFGLVVLMGVMIFGGIWFGITSTIRGLLHGA